MAFDGQNDLRAQGRTWATVVPNDSPAGNFTQEVKAICISSSTGGAFVAVGQDDVEATFYGNPGQVIPIRPKRIKATGLTGGLTLTAIIS